MVVGDYPAIEAQAEREGEEILWADEVSVRSITTPAAATPARESARDREKGVEAGHQEVAQGDGQRGAGFPEGFMATEDVQPEEGGRMTQQVRQPECLKPAGWQGFPRPGGFQPIPQ